MRLLPALFATTLGFCQTTPTLAQTIITTDTVVDFSVGGLVYVQAPAKGPSPLVYFLEGVGFFTLQTYDESTAITTAGVRLNDISTYGSSMVIMTGGRVEEDVNTFDASMLNLFGGEIEEDVVAFDNSVVNIFGGAIDEGEETITGPFQAYDTSEINIFGGVFDEKKLETFDDATAHVFGGVFQGGGLSAFGTSEIFVYGGDFGGLTAGDDGVIHIYGTNLALSDLSPGFQRLSGTLADGEELFNGVGLSGNGRIELHELGPSSHVTPLLARVSALQQAARSALEQDNIEAAKRQIVALMRLLDS